MGSASLILLLLCGIFFAGVAIGLGKRLSIKKINPVKGEAYECGIETQGSTWIQFNIGYYLFSLVFLVFDVEIVFMYPWAVVFKEIGLPALIEIIFFIMFLFVGLLYAFKTKALTWK
jgi:NADH:ubiquinone oxidoreductase subunit 3 (subunit A)